VPRGRSTRRNDVRQYDDLVTAWDDPRGPLAMLRWIARARAALVPRAERPGAVLVDLACGGGLMAPFAAALGYRHVGVDLTTSALERARARGVTVVRGDVHAAPVGTGTADVVTAGEILEHVADPAAVVGEACRLLRPGGLLVVDTIADTWQARLLAVTVAERVPGLAPPGIHDPTLFVDRRALVRSAAHHGVRLRTRGLRLGIAGLAGWVVGRREEAPLLPTRSTAVLFQAWGRTAA